MRVLILFAHPALDKSRVQVRLADAVRDLDGVTLHDLYAAYPELDIDVEREQALLSEHDAVVLQHPFYWYSTPAILKEWQDLVLEHGWAYGSGGDALRGKLAVNAVSAGGTVHAYCRDGDCGYSIRELLTPLALTATLCGMVWLPPFVVYGTHELTDAQIDVHAREYRRFIAALRDEAVDVAAARRLEWLNVEPVDERPYPPPQER